MIRFLGLLSQPRINTLKEQPVEEPENQVQAPDDAAAANTAEIQKLEKVLQGPLKNYLSKVNKPEELQRMLEFLFDNMNPQLQKNAKLRPILMDLIKKF